MRQLRFLLATLGVLAAASAASAQQAVTGPCATPDSLAFRVQNRRQNSVPEDQLRSGVGIPPKTTISSRVLSRALRDLYATNQFEDNISTSCEIIGGESVLIFMLQERRILSDVRVEGADKVSSSSVKDRVDLLIGKPIDPAQVAKDVARIDSLYQSEGYYLAKVKVDTVVDPANPDATTLVFRIDEGRRLAISGVEVQGNRALSASTIVGSISTKPEGFFWWRNGEFDQDKYAEDLSKTIPGLYAAHGYIDMQIVKDTLVIDRVNGKALVRITVNEGPQYKIGDFEVNGAKRFSNEDIARYYPFGEKSKTVTQTVKGLIGRGPKEEKNVFNAGAWQ